MLLLLLLCHAQLYPTLWDPMDYSPPGSSVHGTLQARVLKWVAIPFSRGSSQPRDQTQVSHIAGRFFTTELPGKPKATILQYKFFFKKLKNRSGEGSQPRSWEEVIEEAKQGEKVPRSWVASCPHKRLENGNKWEGRGQSRGQEKAESEKKINKQTGKRHSRETEEGERQQGSFSGQPASTSHWACTLLHKKYTEKIT